MIRRGAMVLLACSGLLMCAWNDDPKTGKEGKAPEVKAPAVDNSKIEVLDTGKAPKAALRFKFKEGDVQYIETTQKVSTDVEMAGMGKQSMTNPDMFTVAEVKVVKVNADGTADCVSKVVKAWAGKNGSNPMMSQGIEQAVKSMVGTTMMLTYSPTGEILKSDMKAGEGADPNAAQSMKQMTDFMKSMSASFPKEEVGPGAKWRMRRSINTAMEFSMDTDMTLTLNEVAAKNGVFSVDMLASVKDQQMTPPGAPPGVKVDIKTMNMKVKGGQKMDWANPMAWEGQLTTTMDGEMGMPGGNGQNMTITMKMNSDTTTRKVEKPSEDKPATDKSDKDAGKDEKKAPAKPQ